MSHLRGTAWSFPGATIVSTLPRAGYLYIIGLAASAVGGTFSALALAVLGLGRALGLWVTAERVEDEEQLAQLRRLGCAVGQGEFLGHPQDATGIERLLGDEAPLRATVAAAD